MNLISGIDTTAGALTAQKIRLDIVAQNIANATGATPDTPLSNVIGGTAVTSTGTTTPPPFVGPIDPELNLPVTAVTDDSGDDTTDDGSDDGSSATDNTGLYIGLAAVGILGLFIASR